MNGWWKDEKRMDEWLKNHVNVEEYSWQLSVSEKFVSGWVNDDEVKWVKTLNIKT